MNVRTFIETQLEEIRSTVGSRKAISAISGGVDREPGRLRSRPLGEGAGRERPIRGLTNLPRKR